MFTSDQPVDLLTTMPMISHPQPIGSYDPDDVVFLLQDIADRMAEMATEDREEAIQQGRHYSEMLPQEYRPTAEYLRLFHETLPATARDVALAAGVVSEVILRHRGSRLVLVSLARAGTPAGILLKRYLQIVHGLHLPHYSVSIIRGKGIDENAIGYILQQHPGASLQFIDGWTGKGAIAQVLTAACHDFQKKYGIPLSDDLAVLADPGDCVRAFGTREDFLIPSACLNATVSGLVSRTVLRPDLIGPNEFHGVKYYREWAAEDLSQLFIDKVSAWLVEIAQEAAALAKKGMGWDEAPRWLGRQTVEEIQHTFGIADINLIKPGIGETTRVLLRRVPWKILVDREDNPYLRHVLLLAHERGVPIEPYPRLTYSCCGLIRPLGGAHDFR